MNIKDTLNFIYNIEEELAVDTWQYAGLKIWPLIRRKIEQQLFFVSEGHLKNKNAKLLSRIVNNTKKISCYMNTKNIDIENNAEFVKEQCGAVFCSTSSARRAIVKGFYYDIFCDPFIEQLKNAGIPSFVLEREYEGEVKTPRFNKSKYINGEILVYILQRSYKSASYLLQGWQLPKNEKKELISRLMAVGIDAEKVLKEIPYNVLLIELVADYYKSILIQIKPVIAFVVVYAGILSTPFVLACRRLNIPVVDIQHSVQFYADYADFLKVPEQGYELLPNFFWCWEEKEIVFKYINGRDRGVHRTIHGGNLWLEKWKKRENPPDWILDYDRKFAIWGDGKFNILYTLQPEVSMPQYLIDAIKSCSPNWLWWIRLHPRMKKDDEISQKILFELQGKNVIFEEATDLPLLSLLRNMDVHITRFSSTVLEAEQMNVPSIIIDETGALIFKQQVAAGVAIVALNYEDIFIILNKLSKKGINTKQSENLPPKSVIELLGL